VSENKQIEKDHDDLHILHEHQTIELENLVEEHQKLKQMYRQSKLDVCGIFLELFKRLEQ